MGGAWHCLRRHPAVDLATNGACQRNSSLRLHVVRGTARLTPAQPNLSRLVHAPANTPGRRCRCLGGARGVIEDSADNRGWPQPGASHSAQTHVRARSRPPPPPPPRPPPRLAAGMYRRLTTKSCKRPHTRQHAALPATAAVATDAGTPAVAALTLTDACPPSPPPPPAASLTRGRGYRMRIMRHTVTWLSSQTATAAAHPPAAAVALAAMHFTRLKACSRRGRRPCCCR